MKKRIITQEMIDDFIRLYVEEKYTLDKISKKYHIRSTTVKEVLQSKNIPIRTLSEMKSKVTQSMVDDFIKMYTEENVDLDGIAKKYSLGRNTVFRHLKANGVTVYGERIKPELQNKIIELYQNGLSEKKIEKEIGVSRPTIRKILKENNIHIRDNTEYRVYSVNENYFDIIDTPNKAYTLGFLYADGNVSKEKYNIQLSLQEGDKHILEQISQDMKSESPLVFKNFEKYNRNQQNQYSLVIHNKHLHSALSQWGIIPNKTHILTYPNFLEENLHRHFIRGVLDGDGCIHPPHGKNEKIKTVDICGTYNFCIGLKNIIESILNIHCSVIKTSPDPKRTTYRVTISGRLQVCKFLDWIYSDADLYLYRKYDIYQKYYKNNVA
jgi:hypothetical protein